MRFETRNTFGTERLLVVAETPEESELIDRIFGKIVGNDGVIANITGQVRLSGDCATHYISLQPIPDNTQHITRNANGVLVTQDGIIADPIDSSALRLQQ